MKALKVIWKEPSNGEVPGGTNTFSGVYVSELELMISGSRGYSIVAFFTPAKMWERSEETELAEPLVQSAAQLALSQRILDTHKQTVWDLLMY